MSDRPETGASAPGGFLAPRPEGQPVDRCFRCGKPTLAGEGLCAEHNPKHLRGPSPTQMHATVFGGLVLGVVGFFIVARLATGSSGPFTTEVLTAAADGAGGAVVSFAITNGGATEGVADCRVTRDGVPRPDDVAFRSPTLASGERVTLERALEREPGSPVAYAADTMSVICT